MPGAFPESQYRQKIRANRSTQKLQLTRARSPQSGRTLFFDLYPFCYPFLGVGLGLGDVLRVRPGPREPLVPLHGRRARFGNTLSVARSHKQPPFDRARVSDWSLGRLSRSRRRYWSNMKVGQLNPERVAERSMRST